MQSNNDPLQRARERVESMYENTPSPAAGMQPFPQLQNRSFNPHEQRLPVPQPAEPEQDIVEQDSPNVAQQFGRGLRVGWDGVRIGYLGSRALMSQDDEGRERWMAHVRAIQENQHKEGYAPNAMEFTEISSINDAVDWAIGQAGAMAPIVGSIMAGGIAGGKAGAKGGAFFGPKGAAVGGIAGSVMGSFTMGYALYAGGLYSDLMNMDVEHDVARETALRYAAPASAVSIVVPAAASASIVGALGREYVKSRARTAVLGAGIAIPAEGLAEAAAEAFVIAGEEFATGVEMDPELRRNRIINAGTAGALMGGMSGTIGGAGRPQWSVDQHLDAIIANFEGVDKAKIHPIILDQLISEAESITEPTVEQQEYLRYLRQRKNDPASSNRAVGREVSRVEQLAVDIRRRSADGGNEARYNELMAKETRTDAEDTELALIQFNDPTVFKLAQPEAVPTTAEAPTSGTQMTQRDDEAETITADVDGEVISGTVVSSDANTTTIQTPDGEVTVDNSQKINPVQTAPEGQAETAEATEAPESDTSKQTLTYKRGKTDIKVQLSQGDDGSFVSDNSWSKQSQAQSAATALGNEYPGLNIGVVDTRDSNDPFAKGEFHIQVKPKKTTKPKTPEQLEKEAQEEKLNAERAERIKKEREDQKQAEKDAMKAGLEAGKYNPAFKDAPKAEGRTETYQPADRSGARQSQFVAVPLDAVMQSHDPQSFEQTSGFPVYEDGVSVNDNDYSRPEVRGRVDQIAKELDPITLLQDIPIIGPDGIVISGNNRTMSIKKAKERYPERFEAYQQEIRSRAEQFGINPADLDALGDFMLVRRDNEVTSYDKTEFARHNQQREKQKSPLAQAQNIVKTMPESDKTALADIVADSEAGTIREMLAMQGQSKKIADFLLQRKVINDSQLAAYYDVSTQQFNDAGRALVENIARATILNENALEIAQREGVRQFASVFDKAIPVLLRIKKIGSDFDLSNYVNDAFMAKEEQVRKKLSDAEFYAQQDAFDGLKYETAIIHALISESTTTDNAFKSALEVYARGAESGGGLFETTPKTREQLIADVFSYIERKLNDILQQAQSLPAGASTDAKIQDAKQSIQRLRTIATLQRGAEEAGQQPAESPRTEVPEEGSAQQSEEVTTESSADETAEAAEEQTSAEDSTDSPAIEDFGEKIGGARKDLFTLLSEQTQSTKEDMRNKPFGKLFPLIDYARQVESGAMTAEEAALLDYYRSNVPTKPRKSGFKLDRYIQAVEGYRSMLDMIANRDSYSTLKDKTLIERVRENPKLDEVVAHIDLSVELGFPTKISSLAGYSVQDNARAGVVYFRNGEKDPSLKFGVLHNNRPVAGFKTREEAVNAVRLKITTQNEKQGGTKFDVWRTRKDDVIHVGKKISAGKFITLHSGFKTPKEAYQYIRENQTALEAELKAKKETPNERPEGDFSPRTGPDRRKGKDITPEIFGETFGFRGVEFGNYVEQERRQQDLNNTYDALIDLAEVMGVSPRALSLNGELGLAFGARGKGGKNAPMAHYEPGKVVINLTKRSGPGTLAHEWWHALDNYFSRYRGDTDGYVTNRPYEIQNRRDPSRNVRPETVQAFREVADAIRSTKMAQRGKVLDQTRSKSYWATMVEMTARSFEAWTHDKLQTMGIKNEYLVSFSSMVEYVAQQMERATENSYPYPTAEELQVIGKAYQNLFDTLIQEKDGDKVALKEKVTNYGNQIDNSVLSVNGETQITYRPEDQIIEFGTTDTESIVENVVQQARKRNIPGQLSFDLYEQGDDTGGSKQNVPSKKRATEVITAEDGSIAYKRLVLEDFKEAGAVSFVGRKLQSPQDLVDMYSIYRSPLVEKMHMIAVNDAGDIVASHTITSHAADYVATKDSIMTDFGAEARAKGATGFWLSHNHPSGTMQASHADYVMTRKWRRVYEGVYDLQFKGHVIMDTTEYVLIDQDIEASVNKLAKELPSHTRDRSNLMKITSAEYAADYAKAIYNKDSITVVHLNPPLEVVGYDVLPADVSHDAIKGVMKYGVDRNSATRFIVMADKKITDKKNNAAKLWETPVPYEVVDVFIIDGNKVESMVSNGKMGLQSMANSLRKKKLQQAERIAEPTKPYDVTGTPEFKTWFGDSKVVDQQGKPLVVYKGMPTNNWQDGTEINTIDSPNGPWAGFFTSNKTVADGFKQAYGSLDNTDSRVLETYLSIQNPYVIDAKGKPARDFMFDDNVFGKDPKRPDALAALNKGHDGIIIKNTADEGDVYVPKSPNQIKSATNNSGAFDANNPDIRFQQSDIWQSNAEYAIQNLADKANTPEQWVKRIAVAGGKGTAQQLEWIGLNDYLADWMKDNNAKSVPRDVVEQYIRDNDLQIQEVELSDVDNFQKEIRSRIENFNTKHRGEWSLSTQDDQLHLNLLKETDETMDQFPYGYATDSEFHSHDHIPENVRDEILRIRGYWRTGWSKENPLTANYGDWTEPGGSDYREILITMPDRGRQVTAYKIMFDGYEIGTANSIEEAQRQIANRADKQISEGATIEPYTKTVAASDLYHSSHFDGVENMLAHARIKTREGANGERILFIEEIQSDWAQDGREHGFKGQMDLTPKKIENPNSPVEVWEIGQSSVWFEKEAVASEYNPDALQYTARAGDRISNFATFEEAVKFAKDNHKDTWNPIANMPYKKTDQWAGMAVRRMLKMAADEGYDRVAWVTGRQTARRYNLSQVVESIGWQKGNHRYKDAHRSVYLAMKNSDDVTSLAVDTNGTVLSSANDAFEGKNLSEIVGKDIAERIMAEDSGSMEGADLEIGGEGHIEFYDSIIPKIAKKEARRFDKSADVEVTQIPMDSYDTDVNLEEWNEVRLDYEGMLESGEITQAQFEAEKQKILSGVKPSEHLSIAITPAMRANLEGAVPLFQRQEFDPITPESAAQPLRYQPDAETIRERIQALYTPTQTASQIANAVSKRVSTWAGASDIVVAESMRDVPVELQHIIAQKKRLPGGVFYKGKSYVLAFAHTNADTAYRTVLHEAIGHGGIRKLIANASNNQAAYNRELNSLYDQVYEAYKDDVRLQQIARKYNANLKNKTGQRLVADELIALLAETSENRTLLQKIAQFIRKVLRDLGMNLQLTDNDIYQILSDSRNVMEQGFQQADQTVTLSSRGLALYNFIGKNAQLTAEIQENLDVAQQMEDQGYTNGPNGDVHRSTGWFRSPYDGKWRYEILPSPFSESGESIFTDLLAELKTSDTATEYTYLSKLIGEDADIISRYPGLANLSVKVNLTKTGAMEGSYQIPVDRSGEGLFDLDESITISAKSMVELESVLAHEIQHAIQYREGFATGASTEMFRGDSEVYSDLLKMSETILQIDELARKNNVSPAEFAKGAGYENYVVNAVENAVETGSWDYLLNTAKDAKRRARSPFQKYKVTAGEIESREVQRRLFLTPQQRKNTAINYDNISTEDAIVIFDTPQSSLDDNVGVAEARYQLDIDPEMSLADYAEQRSVPGGIGRITRLKGLFIEPLAWLEAKPALKPLADAVRNHYDRWAQRRGVMYSRAHREILAPLSKLKRRERKAITEQFEQYMRLRETGQVEQAEMMRPSMHELADKMVQYTEWVAEYAGNINKALGIQVLEPNSNKWRPIGKVGTFFPRKLNSLTEATLRNPHRYPEHWSELVEALIDQGYVENRAEADKYLRTHIADYTANNYFAGIEKARQQALPPMAYDYDFRVMMDYINKWSERTSQIEFFGQETTEGSQDLFKQYIAKAADENTRNFINALGQRVYNHRTNDGLHQGMAFLNKTATGLQLGNWGTATLNLFGGTTLNFMAFPTKANLKALKDLTGITRFTENIKDGNVRKAFKELVELQALADMIEEGRARGAINNDMIMLLRDTDNISGNIKSPEILQKLGLPASVDVNEAMNALVNFTMKWGGYTPTEMFIRSHAQLTAKHTLAEARANIAKNPTSKASLKAIRMLQEHGFDYRRLMNENGQGAYTERYIRTMSNLTQGSYKVDQVPIHLDTPVGRFFFKYVKFISQVSRLWYKDFYKPFMASIQGGSKVQVEVDGVMTTQRVREFSKMIKFFAASAIGGEIVRSMRALLFDYNFAGPELEEIEKALEDDDRMRALGLIFDRAFWNIQATGGLTIFGNYWQLTQDAFDRERSRNPLNPPGYSVVMNTTHFALDIYDQGAKTTPQQIDNFIERQFSLYRTTKRPALRAMQSTGVDPLQRGELYVRSRDRAYVRSLMRKYEQSQGIAGSRTRQGRIGKTENSIMNEQIHNALTLGEPGRALTIYLRNAERNPERAGNMLQSAQSSMRHRRPVGNRTQEDIAAFFEWVETTVPQESAVRARRIQDEYQQALDSFLDMARSINSRLSPVDAEIQRLQGLQQTPAVREELQRLRSQREQILRTP